MPRAARFQELIRDFDRLSNDAVVPTQVTASILNISARTVQRRFPSVQLSPRTYNMCGKRS
jgi:hypothetical protein